MLQWMKEGKLKSTETVVRDLRNAPNALLKLFEGLFWGARARCWHNRKWMLITFFYRWEHWQAHGTNSWWAKHVVSSTVKEFFHCLLVPWQQRQKVLYCKIAHVDSMSIATSIKFLSRFDKVVETLVLRSAYWLRIYASTNAGITSKGIPSKFRSIFLLSNAMKRR